MNFMKMIFFFFSSFRRSLQLLAWLFLLLFFFGMLHGWLCVRVAVGVVRLIIASFKFWDEVFCCRSLFFCTQPIPHVPFQFSLHHLSPPRCSTKALISRPECLFRLPAFAFSLSHSPLRFCRKGRCTHQYRCRLVNFQPGVGRKMKIQNCIERNFWWIWQL